ncbi:phage terminase small subunit P27 family [Enterococcus casseliflavus]|uniref:phage terminase small subunit P27 family n=1 Tax=Enterococcus casseliflavus TaxID=37734 RepID=UPI0035CA6F11
MPKVKLLEDVNMHLSNEQKAQREDAKKELFEHQELVTEAPSWLPQSAISEWNRLIPILKKDFPLSETDFGMLVSYCLAFSRIKTAEAEIRRSGTYLVNEETGKKAVNPAVRVQSQAMKDLKQSASALGMTLEARAKLALNKNKQEVTDPFEELMADE